MRFLSIFALSIILGASLETLAANQVINVLNPTTTDLKVQLGVPVTLKFDKMGGQRVSISATHYPILVKPSEIPHDAYLSHYFMCPMQTMANDPKNSLIWLTSADPSNQRDATHTWLQLNRKGEVTVTFVGSLPTEEAGRLYLNVLVRPGRQFLTWDPKMYDFENRFRDRSKDHLSVTQRARPGNIRGEGCPRPQVSLLMQIAP